MLRNHRNTARIVGSLVLAVVAASIGAPLSAQDPIWRPYVELETRGGTLEWAGQGNLFVPLGQDGDSIVFADLRGHWTDAQAAQGGWGLAYRQMLVNDWIFGVHGAYDYRHSAFNNNFSQGLVGLELLGVSWGLRWNGYFADEGPKLLPGSNLAELVGNNIQIRQASERAYSGTDFEAEALLWYNDANDGRPWLTFQDLELWGAVGFFHYDTDAQGFEDLTGPRARLEMRFYDVPFAGPDSRFVISGQYEHDDVRGSVGTGMLTLRIPFGRGGGWEVGRLRGLNRRIVAPIVRNNDIITQVGVGQAENAAFAFSGRAISQVVTIDANTVNPEGVVASAGPDSLVIVDGSAGSIVPASTIAMQPGQVLMGGGSNLLVSGVNSGDNVGFNVPGSRPTLSGSTADNIATDNDSGVFAMNLVNTGNNLSAIAVNNDVGVVIDQVNINMSGSTSTGISSSGTTRFSVNNSIVSTTGLAADGIRSVADSAYFVVNSAISTSGDGAQGIDADGSSRVVVNGVNIFTSGLGSEGILASGSTQMTVAGGSQITVTGVSTVGIRAATSLAGDNLTMLVSGATVNSTSHSIVLDTATSGLGTLNAIINGNALSALTGANELDVTSGGSGTINLSADANVLPSLTGTIRLNEIGGDLNVTQGAPFTNSLGIDVRNSVPPTNVQIPGGTVDFDQVPGPAPPIAP